MYNNREEIHKTITKISDELRGSVDGWEFKSFVLGSLFYRFLSENITKYINDSKIFEDYENTTDSEAAGRKTEIKRNKGYYIKPSELFSNVCKSSQENKNLGETLKTVFKNIEESMKNEDGTNNFTGMFDDFDVDSNKLGNTTEKRNERLCQLLNGINSMELDYSDSDVDVFGDAYEFLMQMYAGNAGKSGGEFYTPQEASELLARLATFGRESTKTIYDPTCGSGSLLMQAERIIGKENLDGIYGQEINNTSFNLSRINMILNNIPLNKINIACDDTLKDPHFLDKKFDVIVSNPPYSVPWNPSSELIKDPRFAPAGVLAPKSKGDWAFVMHCLHLLEEEGTAAFIVFPGILYRGGAEQKIRQYIVDNNYIDCVIQLPADIFFGTSIATSIVIIKKNKKDNKTLFIDASDEFVKVTKKNKLTEENINNIFNYYKDREDKQNISKLSSIEDIKENSYNLSVQSYVEKIDEKEKIDIKKLNSDTKLLIIEKHLKDLKYLEMIDMLDPENNSVPVISDELIDEIIIMMERLRFSEHMKRDNKNFGKEVKDILELMEEMEKGPFKKTENPEIQDNQDNTETNE